MVAYLEGPAGLLVSASMGRKEEGPWIPQMGLAYSTPPDPNTMLVFSGGLDTLDASALVQH